MASDPPKNRYCLEFNEALDRQRDHEHRKAVNAAKRNLMDLVLPRYWQLKNCILIICAESSWYEAEHFRIVAEELYDAMDANIDKGDFSGQELLVEMRAALDRAKDSQDERRPRVEYAEDHEAELVQERAWAMAQGEWDELDEVKTDMVEALRQTLSEDEAYQESLRAKESVQSQEVGEIEDANNGADSATDVHIEPASSHTIQQPWAIQRWLNSATAIVKLM